MDLKLFFAGVGFLILAYLTYRSVKNERPCSQETNWKGPMLSTYIGLWGCVLMCSMVGIVFILQSLPAQI